MMNTIRFTVSASVGSIHMTTTTAHRNYTICFVGLSGAGKTSIITRLIYGEHYETTPTLGFDVDYIEYRGRHHSVEFQAYDMGGQDTYLHTFWKKIIPKSDALIIVIDAADPANFQRARDALIFALSYVQSAPVMILANKQDLKQAASVDDLADILNLWEAIDLIDITSLRIFPVSAKTGEGLQEAFDWLARTLTNQHDVPTFTIHGAYVYQRETSLPIAYSEHENPTKDAAQQVHQLIGAPIEANPALLTGYYSSIENFAKDIGGTGIKTLVISGEKDTNFMFVTVTEGNLSCLIICEEGDNVSIIELIAKKIIQWTRIQLERLQRKNRFQDNVQLLIDEQQFTETVKRIIAEFRPQSLAFDEKRTRSIELVREKEKRRQRDELKRKDKVRQTVVERADAINQALKEKQKKIILESDELPVSFFSELSVLERIKILEERSKKKKNS